MLKALTVTVMDMTVVNLHTQPEPRQFFAIYMYMYVYMYVCTYIRTHTKCATKCAHIHTNKLKLSNLGSYKRNTLLDYFFCFICLLQIVTWTFVTIVCLMTAADDAESNADMKACIMSVWMFVGCSELE